MLYQYMIAMHSVATELMIPPYLTFVELLRLFDDNNFVTFLWNLNS